MIRAGAEVYDTPIIADVRCGKSIKFQFNANAQVANIEVMPMKLDFGGVHIGTIASVPLSLSNKSQFAASLLLRWPQGSEFTLEAQENDDASEEDGGGNEGTS